MNSLTASTTLGTFNKMRCEENRERGELRREVIYDGGREKVASAQDFFGNQREMTTLGRGFLFLVFLVYLVTILYIAVS